MEIFIGLVIGILIGLLLLVFVVKAKNGMVKKQEQDILQLNQAISKLREDKSSIEIENAKIVTDNNAKMQAFVEKVEELKQAKITIDALNQEREELVKANSSLKAANNAQDKMLTEKESEIEKRLNQQAEQFRHQTETLKLQFKELSEELLKEKTQQLGANNRDMLKIGRAHV